MLTAACSHRSALRVCPNGNVNQCRRRRPGQNGPTNQALASDCVALDSKTVVACRITKNGGAATYNPNDISYTGPPPLPSNICSSLSFGTDGDRYVTYQGSVVANFVVAGIVTHY
eukprot:19600-Heterococcus_DN1.PRE.2